MPPDEFKVKTMYSAPENSVQIARVNSEDSRFDPGAKETFWRPGYVSNKTMFKQNARSKMLCKVKNVMRCHSNI